ncbi:hypothetical protein Bca4012_083605 [Brassica carinata]|uniref:RING-type domain-containing protein n=1 Tax=Brassica carinata TaxID=52824 RepID=A0A8X7SIW6_BRACI|nr:hypothetical protein Bca52824_027118 [Brassica carinata]
METETNDTMEVTTLVSNLALNMESTNTVLIRLHELILEDESGLATHLGLHRICYKPLHGFRASNLSQFLHEREVPHSRELGEAIDGEINHSLATDISLREPVFVTVTIIFIQDRRPMDLKERSMSVIRRLLKAQRIEPIDLKETSDIQCSICIEDFSEVSHENIIQMPQCKHMFHQDCLFDTVPMEDQVAEHQSMDCS